MSFQLPAIRRQSIRVRLTLVYAALFLLSGAILLTITYLVVAHQAGDPIRLAASNGQGAGQAAGTSTGVCTSTGIAQSQPGQLGQCVTLLQRQAAAQRVGYLNTLLVASGVALAAMTMGALGLGWMVSGRALRPLRTITSAARMISASNLHQRLALSGPDDELKELGDTVDGLLTRLEGSFAAQRQFVANASHELRTPLARQRTLIEVALADPRRTVGTLEAACRRALAAGQQQEKLIEALLTLARSQRGLDHYERVDLAAVAAEVAAARAAEADRREVAVTVRADLPALLFGDARLIERLIANLLDNAILHNMPGGSVMIEVSVDDDRAMLLVANSGPVLQPADVPRLFEPFRHGRAERTGDPASPGLGLSIVGAIAAAHGAGLRAWPASTGGGLVIRVVFPVLPGQPRPARIGPAGPNMRAG